MRHGAPWEPTAGTTDRPQPLSARELLPTRHDASALFSECRIVRAHGELDRRNVAPLVRALAEARAARPGRLLLIVDLSEVTFTDSSILAPLCEAWSDCRARGGWMRVVRDNHMIDLVFRHTGLLDRFPAYANAQDAWEGRTADATPPHRGLAPGSRGAPSGRERHTAPNHSTGHLMSSQLRHSRPAVPLLRLYLAPEGTVPRRIDGAWWPRTFDLLAELPSLLSGLPRAWGQIVSVLVNGTAWTGAPGRMLVCNQVVRLRRTATARSPSTIVLIAPALGRRDLLVVPPEATEQAAESLMSAVGLTPDQGHFAS
ncbi:DUF5994 family protein [Streptomyces sp. NPDC054834]